MRRSAGRRKNGTPSGGTTAIGVRRGGVGILGLRREEDSVIWDERCRVIMGLPGLGPASFEQALKLVTRTRQGKMRRASQARCRARKVTVILRRRCVSNCAMDRCAGWRRTGRVYFERRGERPVRVIGVNSDITERKRVEEALRESEDKVRVALETGRIGIF